MNSKLYRSLLYKNKKQKYFKDVLHFTAACRKALKQTLVPWCNSVYSEKCVSQNWRQCLLLCQICGVAVLSFGAYMMVKLRFAALTPNLASFNIANILLITGIIITCVSFLGFLGALKENRCLLLTFFLLLFLLMLVELTAACLLLVYEKHISDTLAKDLKKGLDDAKVQIGNSTALLSDWNLVQTMFKCCGVHNATDWGKTVPDSCRQDISENTSYWPQGCLSIIQTSFEDNFLTIGISVIVLCIIEVLGMCFAMTLFCHISRSGLGYKF